MVKPVSALRIVRVIKINGSDHEEIYAKARQIASENGYLAFKLNKLLVKSKSDLIGVVSFLDFT